MYDNQEEETPVMGQPEPEPVKPKDIKRNYISCYICGYKFAHEDWMKDIYLNNNTEAIRTHLRCYRGYVRK